MIKKSAVSEPAPAAEDAASIAAEPVTPVKLEQPRKGGSFVRQPDGTLKPAKEA